MTTAVDPAAPVYGWIRNGERWEIWRDQDSCVMPDCPGNEAFGPYRYWRHAYGVGHGTGVAWAVALHYKPGRATSPSSGGNVALHEDGSVTWTAWPHHRSGGWAPDVETALAAVRAAAFHQPLPNGVRLMDPAKIVEHY